MATATPLLKSTGPIIGGKIRPGIKVLTRDAAANPGIKSLYDTMGAEGFPFDQIEAEIKSRFGFNKSPLTPKNVGWFTARGADFTVPKHAKIILDRYGEKRQPNEPKRLWRFPAVFVSDSREDVMPHGLYTWKRSELKYWSKDMPDGSRVCVMHGEVPKDPRTHLAAKTLGGRPDVLRPENGGICEPMVCPEYQCGECKLNGYFRFMIPGVPGASFIEMKTSSFYSLSQAVQVLDLVSFLRGGRISGFHNNGEPIFWFSKKLAEVTRLEDGKPKKVKQWLIQLDADIDCLQLLQSAEQSRIRANRVQQALTAGASQPTPDALLLEAQEVQRVDDWSSPDLNTAHEPAAAQTAAEVSDAKAHQEPADVPQTARRPTSPASSTAANKAPTPASPEDTLHEEIGALRRKLSEAVVSIDLAPADFGAYATGKWGLGWSTKQAELQQAIAEILHAITDGHAQDYADDIRSIVQEGGDGGGDDDS